MHEIHARDKEIRQKKGPQILFRTTTPLFWLITPCYWRNLNQYTTAQRQNGGFYERCDQMPVQFTGYANLLEYLFGPEQKKEPPRKVTQVMQNLPPPDFSNVFSKTRRP
jgi:hypothetical protein